MPILQVRRACPAGSPSVRSSAKESPPITPESAICLVPVRTRPVSPRSTGNVHGAVTAITRRWDGLRSGGPLQIGPWASTLAAAGARIPAQPSPLIGRDRDLEALRAMLPSARLLTLTGAGGVGKTRLAW